MKDVNILYGESNPSAKITDKQKVQILDLFIKGEKVAWIAKEFNLSQSYVYQMRRDALAEVTYGV